MPQVPALVEDSAALAACCRDARAYLARARQLLDEEIRTYPTPIPRCDAQFNHLYEQRTRATYLLERMNAALGEAADRDAIAKALAEFVDDPGPHDADRQALAARINTALALGK